MELVTSILDKNPCFTAGRKIGVKGLMLHSIGCPQPRASVLIQSWNHPSHKSSCVHAFIDGDDGKVYQTLPWEHRGWHCGSGSAGSGNNTHIGVEMCEPACIKYTGGSNFTCSDVEAAKAVAERTYKSAVELFAMLCERYKLDPMSDGVIVSHREGHSRGIASNHGDPEHLWEQLGMGYTMDTFRAAVKAVMNGSAPDSVSPGSAGHEKIMYRVRKTWKDSASQKGAFEKMDYAKACADKNPGYSVYDESGKALYTSGNDGGEGVNAFEPYMVRVSTPRLNIRKGPGTNYDKVGRYTGVGTFTIVEESAGEGSDAGWGLLKSYANGRNGWISLEIAEKV